MSFGQSGSKDSATSAATVSFSESNLYPKQREAIFNEARFSVVEASSKSGKTFGCILWLLSKALSGDGGQWWWVSPTSSQADIAYRRIKAMDAFRGTGLATFKDYRHQIELPNRSTISFKTGEQPDNLYGEDVRGCVVDEASRVREEAWHAIRSTLTATRGLCRIIGNVRGRRNWAWELARYAENSGPGSDYEYHKITAYDAVQAGVLASDEIEQAQAVLPEEVFKELYLAEPADDTGNPFGVEAIQKCKLGKLSSKPVRVWGIDLAKKHDWTVMVGLDVDGNMSDFQRFQKPWEDTVRVISSLVGETPAFVDATGVGDPIVERLQKTCPLVEGFLFTSASKQRIMEGLSLAISTREVGILDGVTIRELDEFQYSYSRTGVKYEAPVGMHDDCVCALAMAVSIHTKVKPVSWAPVDDEEEDEHDGFYEIQ